MTSAVLSSPAIVTAAIKFLTREKKFRDNLCIALTSSEREKGLASLALFPDRRTYVFYILPPYHTLERERENVR